MLLIEGCCLVKLLAWRCITAQLAEFSKVYALRFQRSKVQKDLLSCMILRTAHSHRATEVARSLRLWKTAEREVSLLNSETSLLNTCEEDALHLSRAVGVSLCAGVSICNKIGIFDIDLKRVS